jgi:hypothetical protein
VILSALVATALIATSALPAHAIDKCKVKTDKKTGVIRGG